MEFKLGEHPHRRYNPMIAQWVLVCPHRMLRPWSGQEEKSSGNDPLTLDSNNPLCPGATRSNGIKNAMYRSTFVFPNDFPALLENTPLPDHSEDPLFKVAPARGKCRVMCFHPNSCITLSKMTVAEITEVINQWIIQFTELQADYKWIQIFENKGQAMGCSNPHPHCQIWACSFLPSEPEKKNKEFQNYYKNYGRPMLDDYWKQELKKKERIVLENPDWIVVVPFWASWPFETMLISRNNMKRLNDLNKEEIESLARIIKQLTLKYDGLFKCPFPYSMGWHGAPTGSNLSNESEDVYLTAPWTLHAIFYPPLLRSASIRKFMVGFELLCEPQRDFTPEQAAQRLRSISGEIP